MKSLIDGLPPEIADKISADWRKNETDYWSMREELKNQYSGRWVAFAEGKVVASGSSPVDVLHRAIAQVRHPFVTCVGREDEPCRMRRSVYQYDSSYPGEPLPVIEVEFRKSPDSPGVQMGSVIPDTGADATVLPWPDCQRLELDPADSIPGLMGGVGGSSTSTIVFQAWAHLDGQIYSSHLQVDFWGNERILGRDVLNRLELTFQGPAAKVIVNPGMTESG